MARTYLTPLDLKQNELRNARIHNLASAPGSPVEGQTYYDTVTHKQYVWNATAWVPTDGSNVTAGVASVAAADTTATVTPTTGAVTVKVAKALDHTYVTDFDAQVRTSRLDQMAAPTASVGVNNQAITSCADPTNAQDAVNLRTLQAQVQGVTWKPQAHAATTAPLAANTYANGTAGVGATLTANANGALAAQDGVTLAAGERLLVMNEAAAAHDGLYDLTQAGDGTHPWILTRNVSMDTAAEIPFSAVLVTNGTANANQGFTVGAGPFVVGTTAIAFVQFTGVADISVNAPLSKSGNTLSFSGYTGEASIVTVGTVTAGTWSGTAVDVGHGGTGAGTAAAARTNLGATGKFAASFGDGAASTFTITHNLNSTDVVVQCFENATGDVVELSVGTRLANSLVLTVSGTVPTASQYRVIVIG